MPARIVRFTASLKGMPSSRARCFNSPASFALTSRTVYVDEESTPRQRSKTFLRATTEKLKL